MIDSILSTYSKQLETRLDILMPESSENYKAVYDATRYSLLDGGKRIRPILLLEFYKLCGSDDNCAYNFACALEMIHTYSLIHDDLPCMDNDDYRRGKPSCHKQHGEAMALLAGDALLNEAFCVAAKTLEIPSERVVEALATLATYSGAAGMIGGQVMDINECPKTADYLYELYSLKTAALIKAACVCGAILAGADSSRRKAAEQYAEKLGIAFQIIDDILDYEGDERMLGKPIGSDDKNGKVTLVTVLGIEKCREKAKELTGEALQCLEMFDGDSTNLRIITEYLLARNY